MRDGPNLMSEIEGVHPSFREQKQHVQGRVTWSQSEVMVGVQAIILKYAIWCLSDCGTFGYYLTNLNQTWKGGKKSHDGGCSDFVCPLPQRGFLPWTNAVLRCIDSLSWLFLRPLQATTVITARTRGGALGRVQNLRRQYY